MIDDPIIHIFLLNRPEIFHYDYSKPIKIYQILMQLLNADDFHLPSFLISPSDLPKTEMEVAAPILNEYVLTSFGFNFRNFKAFFKTDTTW